MSLDAKFRQPYEEARDEALRLVDDIRSLPDPEHPDFPHPSSAAIDPEAFELYFKAVDVSNLSKAAHNNAGRTMNAIRDEIFDLQERGTPGLQKCFIWVAPGRRAPASHPANCICKEIDAKVVVKQTELMAARNRYSALLEEYYLSAAQQIRERLPKLKAEAEALRKRLHPDWVEERELAAVNALREQVQRELKLEEDEKMDIAISAEAELTPEVSLALERVKSTYSSWEEAKDAASAAQRRRADANLAHDRASFEAREIILRVKAEIRKRKQPSEDAVKADKDGDVAMEDHAAVSVPPKKKAKP